MVSKGGRIEFTPTVETVTAAVIQRSERDVVYSLQRGHPSMLTVFVYVNSCPLYELNPVFLKDRSELKNDWKKPP